MEAFLRGTTPLLDQFAGHIAKNRKPRLEEAADIFIAYLTENEQYFKMMTHFMLEGTLHEGLLDTLDAIERSMLDRFDVLFRKAGAKEDVRLVSHCFFAALNGILITFRRHPGRSDEEWTGTCTASGTSWRGCSFWLSTPQTRTSSPERRVLVEPRSTPPEARSPGMRGRAGGRRRPTCCTRPWSHRPW